jgi:multiple sugar transport system substrate-binding protein
LPPNNQASISDDKFIQEGFSVVSNAAGLAQFYDRDAPAAMASEGMKGFQEFMLNPSKVDEILARLDDVQNEVYK